MVHKGLCEGDLLDGPCQFSSLRETYMRFFYITFCKENIFGIQYLLLEKLRLCSLGENVVCLKVITPFSQHKANEAYYAYIMF